MTIKSGMELYFQPVGATLHFTVHPASKRISARWKAGKVHVSVPAGSTTDRVIPIIESMAGKIVGKKPTLTYRDRQEIKLDGLSARIVCHSHPGNKIIMQATGADVTIYVGSNLDVTDTGVTVKISGMLCAAARRLAPTVLIPRGRRLAETVGTSPSAWKISGGHRILGRCSSDGSIALSYINMFLPQHLRDYIIYHELAHLSEMNHGPRFHKICDTYCNGHEREYIRELNHYQWPILKK